LQELKSGILPEPVELTTRELEIVAGGKSIAFVKQTTEARANSGKYATVVMALASVTAGVVSTPANVPATDSTSVM
jgi:hypothetical protein